MSRKIYSPLDMLMYALNETRLAAQGQIARRAAIPGYIEYLAASIERCRQNERSLLAAISAIDSNIAANLERNPVKLSESLTFSQLGREIYFDCHVPTVANAPIPAETASE